jgi:RNA polymerase sigma-70 factor, ECF subfamily
MTAAQIGPGSCVSGIQEPGPNPSPKTPATMERMSELEGDALESGAPARELAEAAARRSYGKLVAFLAARSGDVAAAEDALAEAFAAALVRWPVDGSPANPEAWLLTVARRRQIDEMRRRHGEAGSDALELMASDLSAAAETSEIPDRRLALLFACAHPAIEEGVRAPLMLQAVLGLDAARIASAFLISPAAMGQRLVRAKTKIRQAGVPFRIPEREELSERLDAVLNAIYAAFSEGWMDATGADVARRDLAEEAIYLCRLVTELLPEEAEAWGLLALMLYAEARRVARRGTEGEYIPLAEQETSRWDEARIEEAEAALLRAGTMGQIGRYQLEAAIQSAHVERRRTGRGNWRDVVELYDALVAMTGSPVAALNRALAVAERDGAEKALASLDAISTDARVREYQPYWAARAELLSRTGAKAEALHAYDVAIGMERDPSVRQFLEVKRALLIQR